MSFQLGAFQSDAFQLGGGGGQNLLPSLLTNANSFYSASVTRGAVNLAPTRFDNVNSFFNPSVGLGLSQTARLNNANAFFGPQVNLALLQAARFNNANSFYSPSISERISPDRFDNANAFYSPTVTQPGGAQALIAEDYVASGYVTPGYVTFPASFTVNEFFSPMVSYAQYVQAPLLVNENTFFGESVWMPYPDPRYVKAGIVYGPGGIYVGTYVGGGRPIYVFDD